MNLVYLIGKIIDNIKYDFIINSKNKAIVTFKIKTIDGTILNIKGYNEKSDYCYRKLENSDKVFIEGYINNNYEIIIKCIKKI